MRHLWVVLISLAACTKSNGGALVDAGTGIPADASSGDAAEPRDGSSTPVCSLPAVQGNCDAYFERFFFNATTQRCERFIYGGCMGNDNNFETEGACEAACGSGPMPDACSAEASDPGLPGVLVHVEADRCTFKSGEPAQFRYRVVVSESIAYSVATSQGCGSCKAYSADPAALIDYSIGAGDVRYCQCDVGCCAPDLSMAYTLAPKTVEGTIDWPGREWDGPSDTGNPLGDAFAPGNYDVAVWLDVPGVGKVSAKLGITVE